MEGSLAFFLGAVVLVPPGPPTEPTRPPADLLPLSEVGGASYVRHDLDGRPLFPRWPVEFTHIALPEVEEDDDDDAYQEAQHAAVSARFERRSYNLTVDVAFAGPPVPRWWRVAQHFANHLTARREASPQVHATVQRSLRWAEDQVAAATSDAERRKAQANVVMYQDKVATLDRQQPAFEALVEEVAKWAANRDEWALMSEEAWQQLIAWRARCPEFGDFTQYWGDPGIGELQKKTFDALPKRGEPAFDNLPADVRELIDARRAPRPRWWCAASQLADAVAEGLDAAVARDVVPLQVALSAARDRLRQAPSSGPLGALWTRLVGKSAEVIRLESDIADHLARLDAEEAKLSDLATFAKLLREQATVHAPWDPMSDADWAQLCAQFKRAKEEFKTCAYRLPYAPDTFETLSLVLLAADERASQALPEAVRDLIDTSYRLPIGTCHQLFGWPRDVQGNAVPEHEGDHLLLQLTADDLLLWGFGDNGVYQFWISPEALARQDWSKVTMTFECH